MNPFVPLFATGTRVAGAVLMIGYLSGLVPGAIVSLVGGLALITFGRALLIDRTGTAVSGAALAITAGSLGVAALRWGTLSLESVVGAQSVLGPTILVGPEAPAVASGVALGAALVASATWAAEPAGIDRPSRLWSRFEGVLAVLAAALVFAAPGTGGGIGELFSSPTEIGVTVAVAAIGSAAVVFAPRVLGSIKARWMFLAASAVAVAASASVVAGSL